MGENDNLTPEETEIEQTTGVDGEEAHRVGEFDDLRDRLERIESVVNAIAGRPRRDARDRGRNRHRQRRDRD